MEVWVAAQGPHRLDFANLFILFFLVSGALGKGETGKRRFGVFFSLGYYRHTNGIKGEGTGLRRALQERQGLIPLAPEFSGV